MKWNEHYDLQGKHAFLGASQNAWLRYDDIKVSTTYLNLLKKEEGIKLHQFASDAIKLRIKVATLKNALNLFINDAIGFKMESEQLLYYSDNCFGTADAISFKSDVLRIHDLKTGNIKKTFDQLYIYAALFCLEYAHKPEKIQTILRIYQGSNFEELEADPKVIKDIMIKIKRFDKIIIETIQNLT